MAYFTTGLLIIKGKAIKIQEVTVKATKELSEVYSSDSKDPDEIRDGRKKVDFSIKRALDNGVLSKYYEAGCEFSIILYNNDVTPPQKVMVLERCKFSSDNIGNFAGDKEVTQDMDGKSTKRRLFLDNVDGAPINVC